MNETLWNLSLLKKLPFISTLGLCFEILALQKFITQIPVSWDYDEYKNFGEISRCKAFGKFILRE